MEINIGEAKMSWLTHGEPLRGSHLRTSLSRDGKVVATVTLVVRAELVRTEQNVPVRNIQGEVIRYTYRKEFTGRHFWQVINRKGFSIIMMGEESSEDSARAAAEAWVKSWAAKDCPSLKEPVVVSPFKLLPKEESHVRSRRK